MNTDLIKQISERCKVIVDKAKAVYGLDLSGVQVRFDLKGRSAGMAGGTRYRGTGDQYYIRFNRDMLTREAFGHVHNDTVPHEYAHVICFMRPELGKNHDRGWAGVCKALGGNGERCHKETVVYGKGTTYEYTTSNGSKVRLSDKRHKHVQSGNVLRYRQGKGSVSAACAYSIVGISGRTLETPMEKYTPNSATSIESAIQGQRTIKEAAPKSAPVAGTLRFASGNTKAATARNLMLTGHKSGKTYEEIIAMIVLCTGHTKQLARAYYKNNVERTGVPPAP